MAENGSLISSVFVIIAINMINVLIFFPFLLSGGPDPDQARIDLRMNAIKHKVLVLSGKGGKIEEECRV
jgi:hypothetical protein